jgi:hypothetical protein
MLPATHVNHFRRVRALLKDGLPLQDFFDRYNELDGDARKFTLQSGVLTSWLWFILGVVPAILALIILFYNFAAALLDFPLWPQ